MSDVDSLWPRFRKLFHDVQAATGDDPNLLQQCCAADPKLLAVAHELYRVAAEIFSIMLNSDDHFATHVDAVAIEEWRDYDRRWVSRVANADPSSGIEIGGRLNGSRDFEATHAKDIVARLDGAISWLTSAGSSLVGQDAVDDLSGWVTVSSTGIDLEGAVRRAALIPFTNFPAHVSNRHGSNDGIYENYRQACLAFIAGADRAALALLRSIVEVSLVSHYGASEHRRDREDKEIKNDLFNMIAQVEKRPLPDGANSRLLHDRVRKEANDVLHSPKERPRDTLAAERRLLEVFGIVRILIEQAPKAPNQGDSRWKA